MKTIYLLLFCALIITGCNQHKPIPKGELAFLLQYNNRLPSDVGFLTNHIMERRMANLMKENYEPFMKRVGEGIADNLVVDTINYVVFAGFWNGKLVHHQVIVDVANDALWIDYNNAGMVFNYADRVSLPKPVLPN